MPVISLFVWELHRNDLKSGAANRSNRGNASSENVLLGALGEKLAVESSLATAQCYWVLGEYLLAEETRDRHGIVTLQIEPSEPDPCQEALTFITALLFAKKKAAKKKAETAVRAVKGEGGLYEPRVRT